MTTTAIRTEPAPPPYPVHVEVAPEPSASRWLWLVKWVLVIPHLVILTFLWMAFGLLSVVAFFAILFTGRYPRSIFDFNVGVLRWSWRVAYYSYGALATDQYPPFTLAEVADYPAHLHVDYPGHLSRGLVLVKWWLLAIPHYLIVAILIGGGSWAAQDTNRWPLRFGGGLVGILALVAAIVLAVTGSYPRPLYDFLLGLNRWVLRVGAYVGLMTDVYPPFRLDQGPHDADATLVGSGGPDSPARGASAAVEPLAPATPEKAGWTAGRMIGLVLGALAGLLALGLVSGGGALLVVDHARTGGYVTTVDRPVRTSGYAVALSSIVLDAPAGASTLPARLLGDVRLSVTPSSTSVPVFVGIAPADRADAYLAGVARTVPGGRIGRDRDIPGSAPASAPGAQSIWVGQVVGTGPQVLDWSPQPGRWAVVVMNADGSAGLAGTVAVGAMLPWLATAGWVVLAVGALLLAAGAGAVVGSVRRASQPYQP
jgi:Domain of unknown function (DUF4389)